MFESAALKRGGFNKHFRFHELRHSYGTALVMSGTNIKIAQELMRHSDINTTMNIYAHVSSTQKQEEINKVFSQGKVIDSEEIRRIS